MIDSVKDYWEHIKTDNILSDKIKGFSWNGLSDDTKRSVDYLYHMAIGVHTENKKRR